MSYRASGIAVALAVVVLTCALLPDVALGSRVPTTPERKELARALSVVEIVAVRPGPIRVSTIHGTWASVQCSSDCQDPSTWVFLFHRVGTRWRRVGWFEKRSHPIGFCAYAPATTIRDLFGLVCPPWRALHGIPASSTLGRDLVRAVLRWTPGPRADFVLAHPCISRLDATWASALVKSTRSLETLLVWFRERGGKWSVAVTQGERTHLPSPSILLSMAACVGYSGSV
jgi:hypothetical protein